MRIYSTIVPRLIHSIKTTPLIKISVFIIYKNTEFGLKSQGPFPRKVDWRETVLSFHDLATRCPNPDS